MLMVAGKINKKRRRRGGHRRRERACAVKGGGGPGWNLGGEGQRDQGNYCRREKYKLNIKRDIF